MILTWFFSFNKLKGCDYKCKMKIDVWKFSLVYLCVLVVSCSCFQNHIQTLTAKVSELFGKKPYKDNSYSTVTSVGKLDDEIVGPQCNNTNDTLNFFGNTWRNIRSKIANNWWIIAGSTLLPFIFFWRVQHNMRKRVKFNQLVQIKFIIL